jgi:hypothetical protein
MLLQKLESLGVAIKLNGQNLQVKVGGGLSDVQREFLNLNKSELISQLRVRKPSNEEKQRCLVYFLKFTNGDSMNYRTHLMPKQAKLRLLEQFIGREIEVLELLN